MRVISFLVILFWLLLVTYPVCDCQGLVYDNRPETKGIPETITRVDWKNVSHWEKIPGNVFVMIFQVMQELQIPYYYISNEQYYGNVEPKGFKQSDMRYVGMGLATIPLIGTGPAVISFMASKSPELWNFLTTGTREGKKEWFLIVIFYTLWDVNDIDHYGEFSFKDYSDDYVVRGPRSPGPDVWQTPQYIPITSNAVQIDSLQDMTSFYLRMWSLAFSRGSYFSNANTVMRNFPTMTDNVLRNSWNLVLSKMHAKYDNMYYRFFLGLYVQGMTNATCKNGYYSETKVRSLQGYAVTVPVCKPCAPGTWNTCRTRSNCSFHVRYEEDIDIRDWTSKLTRVYGDDIHLVPNEDEDLIGRCYPCTKAIYSYQHYGAQTIDAYFGWDIEKKKSLPFFCPGGNSPPIRCPPGSVGRLDANGWVSQCICEPGKYDRDQADIEVMSDPSKVWSFTTAKLNIDCVDCKPGWKCNLGQPTLCPQGTYSHGGASECTDCTVSECPDASMLRPMCEAGSTDDARVCVQCSSCKNRGMNLIGSVYCIGMVDITI